MKREGFNELKGTIRTIPSIDDINNKKVFTKQISTSHAHKFVFYIKCKIIAAFCLAFSLILLINILNNKLVYQCSLISIFDQNQFGN